MAGKRKTITEVKPVAPDKIDGAMFYGMRLDDEQEVFANEIWRPDIDIVFCNAKAGSGKTFVTTGVANLLVQYGLFREIIYIMSPYGERKQGWLPGSLEQKSIVYFDPFYQALIECGINPQTAVYGESVENQKYGTAYIRCMTDTFLRGQNINNSVVIIDEAQNYTVSQLKKVLTRIGSKSKVIVIGHTLQCDLDDERTSGFAKYIEHFRDKDRASICTLVNNHRGWISQHADELKG